MTHALADSMAKACLFLLVAVAVADDATCAASSPGCPSKVQADANTLLQTGVRIGDELAPGRTDEEEEKNIYTDEAAADKAATAGEKAADEQASRERSEKKALRKSNLQLQKQVDKLLKIAASRTVMGPTKAAADKAATAAETAADKQAAASAHSTRTLGENKTRHFGSLLMMKNATTMLAGIQEMARSAEAPAFDQVKEIKILLESMSAILQSTREAANNATTDARASVQLCNTQWDNHFENIQADFTSVVKGTGSSSQRMVHKRCRLAEKAKYDFNLTNSDSPCLKLGASLHDIKQDSFALANFLKVLGQRSDLVMTVNNFVQKLTSDAAEMNSLDASCTAQEGELANKKAECNGKQGEFQQGFCDIKTRLEGQSNTLDECYATSVAAYNRHVTNTRTLVVKWNIEEVTVKKIVCFCDVWLADTDTADKDTAGNDRSQVNQTGKFEACNALNESHAEVDYGQVDPKAAVDLSSVSNHPGESGFITEENGYFDDFYQPVVPCVEATTTAEPTTQAPTTAEPTVPKAMSVALSTDVALPDALPDGRWSETYTSGHSLPDHGVDYIKQCGNSNSDPYMVQYNSRGDTVNLADYITSGGTGGNFGVDEKWGGGPVYIPGDAGGSGKGFGCHANWLITFDLNVIRSKYFMGRSGVFKYTGRFGMLGGGQERGQGVVLVDGVVQAETDKVSRADGGRDLEATIDASAQYLSIAMLNGDSSTGSDDQVWLDPTLTLLKAA